MTLSPQVQIDAVLTGDVAKIVAAFCAGAWDSLKRTWTITRKQVLDEAQRRGWECFVSVGPNASREDFHVLETSEGLVSCYVERGSVQNDSAIRFDTLEAAVRNMLTRRMDYVGL